ncbi:MAG: ATP-binding cassette domain-containing protein [Treponema sp.]|jgi:peptide/nickel transport system permease protein|nr:ATP-binding cassette domain-containing protein [Treponema sp.]
MRKFLNYLLSRPLGMGSLILIVILYLVMIFAEFVAPYAPTTSFASMTYHPPNLRFAGGFRAQEARVTNTVSWRYTRIRGLYTPVRFFAKGEPYRLWGIVPMERHLFTTGAVTGADGTAAPDYPVFLMGADSLGRDLFSRIVYGGRISLTIGFIATAISLALALLFGGLSGYSGGGVDWAVMRFSEFFMLVPALYLILFLRSLLSTKMDSGQTYMMITVILSLVGWPGSARTVRGLVHAIKREEFVLNAQLEMVPAPVIVASHIIPQIASLLIVNVALSIPGFIMTETTLSYLGLGIVDPAVSWGSLIKRDVTTLSNLKTYPWLLNPVWFLLGVTLAFNFLGDCLRDFHDPYHTIFKKPFFGKRRAAARSAKPAHAPRPLPGGLSRTALPGPTQGSLPGPPPGPLLEVKDLSVSFSVLRGTAAVTVQAVRGVSLTVERGEVVGIVGESGSGKSVTTSAIPGILPANASVAGSVLYEGTELLGADTQTLRRYRGKKIGMIFQEPGRSYDPLQNMRNVFFETFRNSNETITKTEAEEKALALLAEVGLEQGADRLSNFPHQFSGGQLQRVGIALALAQGCELLVADEPTTALDVTIQKQIVELLKSLQKSREGKDGKTAKRLSIIFISHNIDLVADISGRIVVMYGGLVMESGPSAEIRSNPLHPYTRALLASSPVLGSHYSQTRLSVIPGRVTDPAMVEPGCPFAPRCPRAGKDCTAGVPPLLDAPDSRLLRCIRSMD